MAYLSVLAASSHYHGTEALTYSYNHHLNKGSLVEISLRNRLVPGIVIGPAKKPEFAVKEIDYVYDLPPLSAASLQLIDWMISFYPAPLGSIANLFLPASLTKKISAYQPEPVKAKSVALPSLTKDQSRVVQTIKDRPDQQTFLLHGDTGTGKTRIYLELAQEVLKDGRDVLVLTPEIGLTPQLVRDFEATFSNQIVVWHSNLTPAQRRNVWLQIITAESPVVVIGPRSALFAPFRQLGLIVVDESHEQAYKQEQQPRYQAIRVASQLAQIYQARLIIGSATPAVAEYYIATVKNIPILRMEELAVRAINQSTDVKIIDSKNKDFFKRNYILSDDLLAGISRALKQKKQSLIFLNRRGTARLVLCQNCGWEQHCPNCDLPLTYHGDKHEMRCHTCGYKAAAPLSCPVCHSNEILYRSVGTKSLVEILAKLFPEARIRRFDTDNTKEEQLAQNYESVANGKVDILAGTQLITKGLDLPKLAMVGIVAADSALSFPDYTADERTYQMLSQVIGRVGRGHQVSQAVVQTYRPANPTILAAVGKDWSSFYSSQLKERQLFGFPPFYHLLKLTTARKTASAAKLASERLKLNLQQLGLKIEVVGPSPSFYEKSANGYRWQLVIKAKDRSQLLAVVKNLPSGWTYDLDPANLL